jgi:hypothetical protein
MNQLMLTYSYKDSKIFINQLASYNYQCSYKHVSTTYIAFTEDDALQIFLEALEDKRSIVYRLLKGGE